LCDGIAIDRHQISGGCAKSAGQQGCGEQATDGATKNEVFHMNLGPRNKCVDGGHKERSSGSAAAL